MQFLSYIKRFFSNPAHIKQSEADLENQKNIFDTMVEQAESILKATQMDSNTNHDPDYKHPIFSYIKLLGLSTQTKYITQLINAREEEITSPNDKLFISPRALLTDDKWFEEIMEDTRIEKTSAKKINLVNDLILPWPWKVSRLLGAIENIGKYNLWGEWRQDNNHRIEVWLPIGVCFVRSGNHSIATGILQGKGVITKYSTMDLSPIYSLIYTDGICYYRKIDNSFIGKVKNIEFAAIFEIGRKLNELNISW